VSNDILTSKSFHYIDVTW